MNKTFYKMIGEDAIDVTTLIEKEIKMKEMEIQKESKILNLSINLLKKIFLELIESMNDKKELIENYKNLSLTCKKMYMITRNDIIKGEFKYNKYRLEKQKLYKILKFKKGKILKNYFFILFFNFFF